MNYIIIANGRRGRKWFLTLIFLRLMWEMGNSTEYITLDFCRLPKPKPPTIIIDDLHGLKIDTSWVDEYIKQLASIGGVPAHLLERTGKNGN